MALTPEQVNSIIRATIRLHQKGKLLNIHKIRYRREAKEQTDSLLQRQAKASAQPSKPETPKGTD